MTQAADVPNKIVARLRAICAALPESREEAAWVGTRWVVRGRNFAHVLMIESGWPPAYARAAGTDGPACVLTFRCPVDEVDPFRSAGLPFFVPVWFPNIVGVVLTDPVNWDDVTGLLVESYRVMAPKKLGDLAPEVRHRSES